MVNLLIIYSSELWVILLKCVMIVSDKWLISTFDQLSSVPLLARRVITSSVLENILIQALQKSEFVRLYCSFLIPFTSRMFYNKISTRLLEIFGKNCNFKSFQNLF